MCANWQMDMTEIEMLFDKLKLIPDQSEKLLIMYSNKRCAYGNGEHSGKYSSISKKE